MEFFEKQVRPLLVARCYKCHGPADEAKGGLRLVSRDAVLAGGDSGPAVVEGKPDESLLFEAVKHDGLKMPPDGKLADQEIAALRKWIELGAPWPAGEALPAADASSNESAPAGELSPAWRERIAEGRKHWSFRPVTKPPIPAVKNADWPQSEIDRFLLATLEAKGLSPSPPAERAALLRRVTFDLIGLPPTPEEVDDFIRDESPQAWAKVVDRLLASPHYGERWGRHWLDVARYADTKGYVLFQEPTYPWAYAYRDYVIRALNEDLPYDRFLVEQLAADRLPLGEDKRPLAAMGFLTIGPAFMNEHDRLDDQIDVVMRGLQGLTVSCARCHDHKFDPIPTRDYYSLYGVMASSVEPVVPPLFEPPPATPEYEAFTKELTTREQALAAYVDKKYAELEQSVRARLAEYLLAADAARNKPATDEFMLIADGADLNPVMISRWQAYLERSRRTKEPVFALWHALAALPEAEFSVRAPQEIARFAAPEMAGKVNALVLAAVVAKPPATLAELAARYGEVLAAIDAEWSERLKQATTGISPPPTALDDPLRQALRQVYYAAESPCTLQRSPVGDLALLPDRASQGERNKLLTAVEQWRATGAGAPPRAMSLEDRPTLYEPRVFGRGNPSNLREAVPRQFLYVLSADKPQPFAIGSGRLELAQAIADRNNPLTARVMVNRVWLHHFGAGLVHTPSDFGLRGEPPTHPELLDYLAAAFMDDGWSLKKLHRRILLSAAYQQASADRAESQAADPENRLLWKFPRQRLEFEPLRDSLLAAAGRLDGKLFGPANQDLANPEATRRTIYSSIDRLNMPGVLRTFDFPNPDSSNPQRDLTAVPQQGLFLMNHALVQTAARRLIERAEVASRNSQEANVDQLYRLLFARHADADEIAAAKEFLGAAPSTQTWYEYAQGLLMTNEFAFLD